MNVVILRSLKLIPDSSLKCLAELLKTKKNLKNLPKDGICCPDRRKTCKCSESIGQGWLQNAGPCLSGQAVQH